MRYPISEKLEIIRLVERSHLPVRRTLDKLGIPKTTFYRWYDLYLAIGEVGLKDCNSNLGRVWNRIPDDVRVQIVDLALHELELSPRELAVRFTDSRTCRFLDTIFIERLWRSPKYECIYLHAFSGGRPARGLATG